MTLYAIYQNADRFARREVSAFMGTHKIDPDRRYVGEDAALRKICEQLSALAALTRVDPAPEAARSATGSVTVRSAPLHAVFVARVVR